MIVPTEAQDPRRTFTLVGTADFNGGGTAGATLILLDTAEAQEIFLDGEDAFTSVPSRAPTVSPRRSSPPRPPRLHRRASPP